MTGGKRGGNCGLLINWASHGGRCNCCDPQPSRTGFAPQDADGAPVGRRHLDGSGWTNTGEEPPSPATVPQVEQRGRTVLLPQARLGFPLVPGGRFRDQTG